jgi:hypothetical protein
MVYPGIFSFIFYSKQACLIKNVEQKSGLNTEASLLWMTKPLGENQTVRKRVEFGRQSTLGYFRH